MEQENLIVNNIKGIWAKNVRVIRQHSNPKLNYKHVKKLGWVTKISQVGLVA